jgi:DNA replication and repair protein RecF
MTNAMGLSHLVISEFRNLTSVTLAPKLQGFNCIHGVNGSGKTSLLEAIYYLSMGRSFRSLQTERIIQYNAQKLSVLGRLSMDDQSSTIGLERYADGKIKLRVNGEDVSSIASLASLIPVQLIDSHCHSLLDSGPGFRRKYIDFGLFHLRTDFLRLWRDYERALKQRNAALRCHAPRKELDSWIPELANSAMQLDEMRCDYLSYLMPLLTDTVKELLPISQLKINYFRGWDQGGDYADILRKTANQDYKLGYTQNGPHKADLKIIINDIPAKDILSRGQQKLFVCAMILARGSLLRCHANKTPIYLVDDLPSELDNTSRASLIALLLKQEAQVFITTTDEETWHHRIKSPIKMFHVEHGGISEINTNGVIKSEPTS